MQFRGCETWIVREGYEGLVRGNVGANDLHKPRSDRTDSGMLHNLRFDDGELLKDGTGDSVVLGGRSLKGRYIVRVGWDDVRGWFAEVSLLFRRLDMDANDQVYDSEVAMMMPYWSLVNLVSFSSEDVTS